MTNLCPLHQFEIRFTPILNFAAVSKELIGPYMQRTSSFQIESENTVNQKLNLNFENDSYSVILWWDKLIFRTTIGFDHISDNNSIIQEPFFSIFKKISDLGTFGRVNNSLFYALSVNVLEIKTLQESVSWIADKYLNKKATELVLPGFTDTAIVVEKKDSSRETNVTFGPYENYLDFNKRNVILTANNLNILKDKRGTMIEYKTVSYDIKEMDFKFYKNELRTYQSTIAKI